MGETMDKAILELRELLTSENSFIDAEGNLVPENYERSGASAVAMYSVTRNNMAFMRDI